MANLAESSFSPTSPHFFAIVLHQTLLHKRLRIPNKIVKKCGSSFRDDVLLKLPCGSEWKLGLTKSSEGRVYIDKGWLEFSKHYSIGLGHLLSLRFDGNSRFSVVIFDTTTTEIDYPIRKGIDSKTRNPNNPVKEEEEEVIEISGDDEDDNPPCPRPRKRMREGPLSGEARDNRAKGRNGNLNGDNNRDASRLSTEEKERALARVSGFKSDRPYFMRVVQPSYIGSRASLNIPAQFARSRLGASKHVVLRDPGGRSWEVKYKINGARDKANFLVGWSGFARENGLKIGDVCVFVMTESSGTVVFEVSFFDDNGVDDSASNPVKTTRDRGSFRSKTELFSVYMYALYINGGILRIPANFARTYMKKEQSEIRLCVSDGRCWSVRYDIQHEPNGQKRRFFCKGWSTFTQDNGLQEGDICTFKLTNRDDTSFEVRIVKPTHKAYELIHEALRSKRTKPLP